MSFWSDRVANHTSSSVAAELHRALNAISESGELTPEAVNLVRRASHVADVLLSHLNTDASELVPPSSLDALTGPLQNALNEVRNFTGDKNAGHLENANQQLDQVLPLLSTLPLTESEKLRSQLRSLRKQAEEISAFQEQTLKALEGLKAVVQAQSDQAANLQGQWNTQFQALTDAVRAEQSSFTTLTEARINETRAEIDSQKGRLDSAISQTQTASSDALTQQQAAFSEAQEKRLEAATQLLTTMERSVTAKIEEIATTAEARHDELSTQAASAVAKLEGHERTAARIVGLTAASAVADAYKTTASEQRAQADTFRIVALVTGVLLLIGAVVSVLLSPIDNDMSTSEVLVAVFGHVPVGAALLGVSTYAATQSAHHRSRERSAEQRALELTTFRPFLEELDETERRELIKEIARKAFFVVEDGATPAP